MVLLLLAVGCQQDLVRVMGTVTRVRVVPRPPSLAVEEAPHETPSPPATVSTPTSPLPQPVASAEPAERPGSDPAKPAQAPGSFNPISMPEGPRDSPGVRWQGVRGKTQEEIANQRSLRKRDP